MMSDVHHGSTNADSSGSPLLEDSFQEVEIHRSSEAAPLPTASDHAPSATQQDASRNSALQSSIASDEKKPCTSSTKARESWFSVWLWELLAVATSVGCLIINLAILLSINAKPLKSWTVADVDITPNALISIFATLSKSAMLCPVAEGISQLKWIFFQRNAYSLSYLETFDSASRGPLGALGALWQFKFQAMLASVGAVVTVLAIAIDPFTQQILSYPTSNVPATNVTTSVHATTTFNWAYLEPGILQGTFAPSTLNVSSCPAAKCHWPSYKSLGICSECTNDTASAIINCGPEANNGTHATICHVVAGKDTRYQTRFTLHYDDSGLIEPQGQPWGGEEAWYIAAPALPRQLLSGKSELATFSFLEVSTRPKISPAKQDPDVNLTTCTLSLCQKTYAPAHFSDGSLETSAPSSETVLFDCPFDIDDPTLHWTCPGVPISQMPASGNLTKSYIKNPNLDVYWADNWTPFDTSLSMSAILMNSASLPPTNQRVIAYAIFAAFTNAFGQDFAKMMDSIALGITEHLRRGSDATEIAGEALFPVVFVQVRWPWFAYPVLIIFLAVAFWVATVVFSCGESRLVWKTSSLALLFHGTRGWNVEDMQTDRIRDMNEAAKDMTARLTRDDGGNIGFVRS